MYQVWEGVGRGEEGLEERWRKSGDQVVCPMD